MRRARRWGVALALGGALACGGDATGPRPGALEIRLATPTPDADGAILFTVAGPAAPLAASASPGLRIFYTSLQGTTTFAVTGTLAAGVIARIEVADVGPVGAYVATIQQVARSDYALRTLTGYALTVTR
jgi:hypothetical protein